MIKHKSCQKGNAPVLILMIIVVLSLGVLVSYLIIKKDEINAVNPVPSPTSKSTLPVKVDTVDSLQSGNRLVLEDEKSQDALDFTAKIKVPFIRNGNLYLYEDGKEKLIAMPKRETTQEACFNLLYPLISPNGKYIAYLEGIGEPQGYGGCLQGTLRLVDIPNSTVKVTAYETGLFDAYSWTSDNLLKAKGYFEGVDKYLLLDPITLTELVSETNDTRYNGAVFYESPIFNQKKYINYENSKFFLVDANKETSLFNESDVTAFSGWSPDGKYALFDTTKPVEGEQRPFFSIRYAVNTLNLNEPKKEIAIQHGAAGGDFRVGNRWFFNRGFVSYCAQYLFFIDGTKPLELTNSGGGGCHNEEGFVATSPSGDYAFIKFSDRFELQDKNGSKQTVKEEKVLTKGRGFPKNLVWLNNDYMVMYESVYGDVDNKPTIHIYERKNNVLKPLIENAYLIQSAE